jgi:hypothetical protein
MSGPRNFLRSRNTLERVSLRTFMRAILFFPLLAACATVSADRRTSWETDVQPAVEALRGARFSDAVELSQVALQRDRENSRANAVAAVGLFREAVHDLISDLVTLGAMVAASAQLGGNFIDMNIVDGAFNRAEDRLALVDQHLVVAAKDPGFSMELCLACWEVDWNRNGEVDDRDRMLMQIELDAAGERLPPGDPRRKPTFHLDVADVHWLRAAVSFGRAGVQVAQAYDWTALAPVVIRRGRGIQEVRIKLRDPKKMHRAGDLIALGLSESLACRDAALAELDDDREWMPNPRQKSHPMPLEVDAELYETWALVVRDAQKMLAGEEALSVAELARLADEDGRVQAPRGYLMLGKLFREPHDLVVPLERARRVQPDQTSELEALLGALFGTAYMADARPSAVTRHLVRMNGEVRAGRDSFERKLRYLLWIN